MRDIFQNPEQKSLSPENYGVVVERHAEVMQAVELVGALAIEQENGDQYGSTI